MEEEFRSKTLDTSTLGPIKIERNNDTARAKMVRDALDALAMQSDITVEEHWTLGKLARIASDVTLARLGRMLK